MALASLLVKEAEFLILDEPTNNLDLSSIQQIESALHNYQGALIIISHDQEFLKNVGVERKIELQAVGSAYSKRRLV